jgi:hypothetical protein
MRYTAWVALKGEKQHGCVLADISDTGARLDVEDAEKLPDKFVLLLSSRGPPKRKCRVIWRAPHQRGVAFDRRLAQAHTVRTLTRPDADAAQIKREKVEPKKVVPEPAESA